MHKDEYVQKVCSDRVDLSKYRPFFNVSSIERLFAVAEKIQGMTWLNMNTSCFGGGVGENLSIIAPFVNSLGVNANWYVHDGGEDFFVATKKIHDSLQGLPLTLTQKDVEKYFGSLESLARSRTFDAEFTVVHDYQLVPLITSKNTIFSGSVLWSSHLETSGPTQEVLNLLQPFVQKYDASLFAHKDYVFPGLECPIFQMCPAIDPLHPKNYLTEHDSAISIASGIEELDDVDLERKIVLSCSRFDVHKNLEGNIEAFSRYKKLKDDGSILIIVGDSSTMDDPDCKRLSYMIKDLASQRDDVYVVENPEQNQLGALMSIADIFLHLAKKEGFGRVIAESLWHGTPAITSSNPGVKLQVSDYNTGFIVKFDDYNKAAHRMVEILGNDNLQQSLGTKGHQHIKSNFLIDSQVGVYLRLMDHFVNHAARPEQYLWG